MSNVPGQNGTPVYTRQHSRSPTLPQLNAIDLLVTGKTDQETAELLGLSRTTVTKWRLYDPVFQAALNVRRAEVWAVGADRLRALIPKALDVLADELGKPFGPARFKAAVALLKLIPLTAPAIGPTDPDEIVRQLVVDRRSRAVDPLEDTLDEEKGLPPMEKHIRQTWKELDDRAQESSPEPGRATNL